MCGELRVCSFQQQLSLCYRRRRNSWCVALGPDASGRSRCSLPCIVLDEMTARVSSSSFFPLFSFRFARLCGSAGAPFHRALVHVPSLSRMRALAVACVRFLYPLRKQFGSIAGVGSSPLANIGRIDGGDGAVVRVPVVLRCIFFCAGINKALSESNNMTFWRYYAICCLARVCSPRDSLSRRGMGGR